MGWVGIALGPVGLGAQGVEVPFDSPAWTVVNGSLTEWEGTPCFQGVAVLDDVDFADGVIEVDMAVDGGRSYPGLLFRMQSQTDYERFYLRPHKMGLYPDALQYTPVFKRVAGWQLYSGEGYTAGTADRRVGWVHVRLEVGEDQAQVFLDDAPTPALVVPHLEHGKSRGGIGVLGPTDGSACFANFSYDAGADVALAARGDDPGPASGVVTHWELSRAFKADQVSTDSYPRFYALFAAGWEAVVAASDGLLDVSRYRDRSAGGADLVMARTVIPSDRIQDVALSFGYSDDVALFFNGRKVFSGRSGYQYRDPTAAGIIGYHDAVHLTLRPGLNEVFLMVSEAFGGWGFMARLDDAELTPARVDHTRTSVVWQTPDSLLTPEGVLHDPVRDVLYVSNFDAAFQQAEAPSGYLSRLTTDGAILEQRWVEGLDAPTGLALDGHTLWVLERGTLTEVHAARGQILNRYPIPAASFPNDVAVGPDGSVYVSDTSPGAWRESRIYRFKDGELSVWLDGDEITRANALYVHGGELLVGNSGDGTLKAVDLEHRTVRDIVTLGAGVIDGIRVHPDGGYLVSLWEGALFHVGLDGSVVEVYHGRSAGLNSADFEYLPDQRLLVIPTYLGNRVVALRLGSPTSRPGT